MNNLFKINKKNKEIVLTQLMILTLALLGLFFMLVSKTNNFNENLYLYSFLFQLFTYSFLISLWDVGEIKIKELYFEILLFTISSIPHLVLVGVINGVDGKCLLLPLCIEYLWGISIVSIKAFLTMRYKEEFKPYLIVKVFIFLVMITSLVFLYFYYHYANLVLVSIFDKRIPLAFFLNPALTSAGVISTQLGKANYLGYRPIYFFFIFWMAVVVLANICIKKKLSR